MRQRLIILLLVTMKMSLAARWVPYVPIRSCGSYFGFARGLTTVSTLCLAAAGIYAREFLPLGTSRLRQIGFCPAPTRPRAHALMPATAPFTIPVVVISKNALGDPGDPLFVN